MTDTPEYTPPEIWVWKKDDSPKWRYGNINRPIAGATHDKELARGKHPLQLYSLGACPSNSGFCWSEKRESDSLPPHEQDIPRLEDR